MNAENFYKKHLVLGDVDLNKQTPLTHQGVIHIMDLYHQNQLMLGDVVEQSKQLVCCENCVHFNKEDKTCGECCVNWSAYNKAN